MLTSDEIKGLVRSGDISWSGEMRGDSLLLHLGSPMQLMIPASPVRTVDLTDQASIDQLYRPPSERWESMDLASAQMVLCQVQGFLKLPAGLAGVIGTLSHLARTGLATHITSPWVLPGWEGHLTLELLNVGPATLRICRGMPVARLLLFKMQGPVGPAVPHPFYGTSGDHLGSRYALEFPAHEYRR